MHVFSLPQLICVSAPIRSPAGGHLQRFPFHSANKATANSAHPPCVCMLGGEDLLEWSAGNRVNASSAFQAKLFLQMLVTSSTSHSSNHA